MPDVFCATAARPVTLNTAQESHLDKMDPDARVVGQERGCPIIEQPDGRLQRLSAHGRLVPINRLLRQS